MQVDQINRADLITLVFQTTIGFAVWRDEHEPGADDPIAEALQTSAAEAIRAGDDALLVLASRRFLTYAAARLEGLTSVDALARAEAPLVAS